MFPGTFHLENCCRPSARSPKWFRKHGGGGYRWRGGFGDENLRRPYTSQTAIGLFDVTSAMHLAEHVGIQQSSFTKPPTLPESGRD